MKNYLKPLTLIVVFIFCLFFTHVISAQVEVSCEGQVALYDAQTDSLTGLCVSNYDSIDGNRGILVRSAGSANRNHKTCAMLGMSTQGTGSLFGVKGAAYKGSATSDGRAYGVYGLAGNQQSGFNYGVYGTLYGSNYGAGVFGTTNGDTYISGTYAGYFYGDAKVTGAFWANTVTESDYRYKENIVSLDTRFDAIEKLSLLSPVAYRLKSEVDLSGSFDADTVTQPRKTSSALLEKEHLGFIAQEVEEIFPELVYTNESGYKGINYIELIPVLVEAIKSQSAEIEALRKSIGEIEQKSSKMGEEPEESKLYQNSPNPFTKETIVKYFIADGVNEALIFIFDMSGKYIKQIPVHECGSGKMILKGNELEPGLYVYALVCDGEEVDDKRLIITK